MEYCNNNARTFRAAVLRPLLFLAITMYLISCSQKIQPDITIRSNSFALDEWLTALTANPQININGSSLSSSLDSVVVPCSGLVNEIAVNDAGTLSYLRCQSDNLNIATLDSREITIQAALLDAAGRHTILSAAATFIISYDTSDPVISASDLTGTYHNNPAAVTLAVSEPAAIYYCLTAASSGCCTPAAAAASRYSNSLNIRTTAGSTVESGRFCLAYFAIDSVNNNSAVEQIVYTVDPEAPLLEIIPATPNGSNAWYTAAVSLSCSKTVSSAANINQSSYNANYSSDGEYTVSCRDLAAKASNTLRFKIDRTPPTIQVTAPNGGEIFYSGNSNYITWSASDNLSNFNSSGAISLDFFDGRNWQSITTCANSGRYSWSVPWSENSNSLVRATATDKAGLSAADVSNGSFTIYNCSICRSVAASGNSNICSPANNNGANATALRCTAAEQGCRKCSNGDCSYYNDGEWHNCAVCYGCDNSGNCSSRTRDGTRATELGCTKGDEACRRCNSGLCDYYTDSQHGCGNANRCTIQGCCAPTGVASYRASFSFACDNNNSAPSGWNSNAGDGSDSKVAVSASLSGHYKVLQVKKTGGTTAASASLSFPAGSATSGTVEFWLYKDTASGTDGTFITLNGNSADLTFYIQAGNLYHGSYPGTLIASSLISSNTWYHFRIDFDVSQGARINVAGTWYGYGGSGYQYSFSGGSPATVTGFTVQSHAANCAGNYSAYLDAFGYTWDNSHYNIDDNNSLE